MMFSEHTRNKRRLVSPLIVWIILSALIPFSNAALTDNILHYWTFNETTGSNASNLINTSFNGTAYGTNSPISSGIIAYARNQTASATGTNYVDVKDMPAIADYSVSLWFNPSTLTCASECDLFGTQNTGTLDYLKFGTHTTYPNKIYFGISTDGSNYKNIKSTANLSIHTWQHIVVTRSGSNTEIHINGVNSTTYVSGAGAPSASIDSGTSVTKIGTLGGATDYSFPGGIDEVGVWNRVLTGAEITQLYNSGNGLTYPFTTEVPSIVRYQQIPADINLSNIFQTDINITFNTSYINRTNMRMFWKTNSTNDSCGFHINGVSYCGMFNQTPRLNYSIGASNISEFNLSSDYIVSGTYNLAPWQMDSMSQINITVGNNNAFIKTRFYNVTTTAQYFDIEFMVINLSAQPLHVWYCNSSYTTGVVTSSPYCTNFYDLVVSAYNHCHSNYSCHYLAPFVPINQTVNGVKVTNLSYILYQGGTQWNYMYVLNNTGSLAGTLNGGTSWTNLPATTNMHIHQYSNDTMFWYYATDGTTNSTMYNDSLNVVQRAPTSPVIYSPIDTTYSNTTIPVNYSNASVNIGSISNYYIYLKENGTDAYIETIDNGLNNTYDFNSTNYADGFYYVVVRAVADDGQYSDSYSETFRIVMAVSVPSEVAEAINAARDIFVWAVLLVISIVAYFISMIRDGSLFLKVSSLFLLMMSIPFAPSVTVILVTSLMALYLAILIALNFKGDE